MSISENLKNIRKRIAQVAAKSGKTFGDITLVAVTKTVEAERINEAISLGITDIGENRVQELLAKNADILPSARHLIGHLQTNKVRQIIGKVSLIHSVDSLTLLREIDNRAGKLGIVQDILIQVNTSGEESKFGVAPKVCSELAKVTQELENVNLRGIMTMAPLGAEEKLLRNIFARTGEIFDDISVNHKQIDVLSMGMSGDFETAIECGANMVRIGSGIFKK